jgi:transposase
MVGGKSMIIEIEEIEKVFHIPESWYIDSCIFNDKKQQLDDH